METVFGTILVIIVTGIVVGIVIPMMVNLILKEIEGYQRRKAVRAGKVALATLEAFSKGFVTIMNDVNEVVEKKKTVNDYWKDLEKMADEASENHKDDFKDLE